MTTQCFSTTIKKSGAKTIIALPFNPEDVWGAKQRHHVSGAINGHAIRGSLGSDGARFFLPLGAAWLRDTHLDAGAAVEVVLSAEGPQLGQMAQDFTTALDAEPQARAFFESLATFYRKKYVNWIESAKRPETRSARIEETLKLLKAGKKQ